MQIQVFPSLFHVLNLWHPIRSSISTKFFENLSSVAVGIAKSRTCLVQSIRRIMKGIINEKAKDEESKIRVLRIIAIISLGSLLATVGPIIYILLHGIEVKYFEDSLESISRQLYYNLDNSIARKISTCKAVGSILGRAMGGNNNNPNFTFANFESTMTRAAALSDLRSLAFCPLVNDVTRAGWEAYATENINKLHGPPSLNTSINGSWVISDGIYNLTSSGKKIRSTGYISGSRFPNLLFPVWQVAPIAPNADIVMLDSHGVTHGDRLKAIDNMLTLKRSVFSNIVQLVPDGFLTMRPSTIIFSPIQNPAIGEAILGMISGGFTWDSILSGIIQPYFKQVNLVVKSRNRAYTFEFIDGKATFIGEGEIFDTTYKRNAILYTHLDLPYEFALYPSNDFHKSYVTDTPRNICLIVIIVIAVTASTVLYYGHLLQRRDNQLFAIAKQSFMLDSARDAVFLDKKSQLHYMSQEMQTPMNAMQLGLKALTKDLLENLSPDEYHLVTTLQDICTACDSSVLFLNDLNNFAKMEDEGLSIQPEKIGALTFLRSIFMLFDRQMEDTRVTLEFDYLPNLNIVRSTGSPKGLTSRFEKPKQDRDRNQSSSFLARDLLPIFLTEDDYINVDEQKMIEVLRYIITNAVNYTPDGGTVMIRARKMLKKIPIKTASPDTSQSSSIIEDVSNFFCIKSVKNKVSHFFGFSTPTGIDLDSGSRHDGLEHSSEKDSSGKLKSTSLVVAEMLVLEVIDTGKGMTSEQIEKMFGSIEDFDPAILQSENESGLGSIIVKFIVSLHKGTIVVRSDGLGMGCVFTLEIPLSTAPDNVQDCDSNIDSVVNLESVPVPSALPETYADL